MKKIGIFSYRYKKAIMDENKSDFTLVIEIKLVRSHDVFHYHFNFIITNDYTRPTSGVFTVRL